MSKAKILLGAVAAIGTVTGALAFKASKFHTFHYAICDIGGSGKCDLQQTVTVHAISDIQPFPSTNSTVTNALLTAASTTCTSTAKCGTVYLQSGGVQ